MDERARLLTCLDVPRWADEVLARWTLRQPRRDGGGDDRDRGGHQRRGARAQALARHPRIGERADAAKHDAEPLDARAGGCRPRRRGDVARQLAEGNRAYEERFGRVFIIRAAGRDAAEILDQLRARLDNTDEAERAETINQLTADRAAPQPGGAEPMTTLSTHVLDTSLGRPASGVAVVAAPARATDAAEAVTDADGRVARPRRRAGARAPTPCASTRAATSPRAASRASTPRCW